MKEKSKTSTYILAKHAEQRRPTITLRLRDDPIRA